MREFRFRENAELPRLAWCAELERSSPIVTVEHGAWVETAPGSFAEGAWNAPFAERNLAQAEIVLGSGGYLRGDDVVFTPTTHTMERLYSLRVGAKLFVSNSLSFVLEATRSRLDVRDWSYESVLMTFLRGYLRAASELRIADGRIVRLHYHRSIVVDEQLSLAPLDPPEPPAFANYAQYVDYLVATLEQLLENGADAARRVKYEPLTTISSGYDSPACAVLARRVGCGKAVTFGVARQAFAPLMQSDDDSGEEIARLLGLAVETYSRDAYLESSDCPEAAFIATGNGGDDVVLSALGARLERTMLFTGMLGDTLWGIEGQDPGLSREYRFRYPAGGSIQEHRLTIGFVHMPIPLLTFTRHAELRAISRSPEMSSWRLGTRYDRPIPRRLVEEEGVPRDAFAKEKRAITQPFWLQRASPACMSRASLADFAAFVARCNREYPLGALQMRAHSAARKGYYKLRRRLRPFGPVDPYYSPAYEAVATSEPLRFHWSVERRRAAYRSTSLSSTART